MACTKTFGVALVFLLSEGIFCNRDDYVQVQTYGAEKFDKARLTVAQDNLVFEVMACKEAMIAASKVPQQLDKDTWVITLGSNDNTKSEVVQKGSSTTPKSFDSKDVLSCSEFRTFWVRLADSTLDFGKGNITGKNIIGNVSMSAPDTYPFVAFDTGNNQPGHWRFLTNSAHDVTLATSSQYMHNQTWLALHQSQSIIFQVLSCSDAYVLLSETVDNTTSVYEIAIGKDHNGYSEIRYTAGGDPRIIIYTPKILSCAEYRTFWILWMESTLFLDIFFGKGPVVGSNALMHTRDHVGKDIKAVSFSTGFASKGMWRINNVGFNAFTVVTPDDGNMQRVLIHEEVHHFEFFVRTCESAAVLLSTTPLNGGKEKPLGYRIIFGAEKNTKITLGRYPGTTILEALDIDEPVSCHAERYFWIAWSGSTIRIGNGKLFEDEKIHFTDDQQVSVSTISLYKPTDTGRALWEFAKEIGKSSRFLVAEKSKSTSQSWFDLTDVSDLTIKVKACQGVSMLLARYLGVSTTDVYEILIGDITNENVNSIRNGVGGDVMAGDKTKDVLDCTEMRWIWIAWTETSLSVGHGVLLGGNMILNWTGISNRIQINAFGFRGHDNEATFEFAELPRGIYEVVTPTSLPHNNVWLAMHRKYFQFEVRSCAEAMIALTEIAGNTTWHAYEVKLGVDNNKTYIYDAESGTNVAEADTPNILNCDDFRSFWIVWTDVGPGRSIHVGSGQLNSKPYIIEYVKLRENAHIRSVSLHSKKLADWKFPDDSGSATTFFTPQRYNEDKIYRHVGQTTSVVFQVQACMEAHILLFDHYHTKSVYEVSIGSASNQETWLRAKETGLLTVTAKTPSILSCNQFREFWVSWANGRLAVGQRGVPLLYEIANIEDPTPEAVNYLSITTGFNSEGRWIFYGIPDNTYLINTHGLTVTDDMAVRFAQGQTTYSLGVRACEAAIVMFLEGSRGSKIQYQVNIGFFNNTKTIIVNSDGLALVQRTTPDILSCTETRYFAFKWQDRTLQMFEANHQGRMIIFYSEPEDNVLTTDIHGLTLATTYQTEGEWEVSRYEALSMEYHHIKNSFTSDYCCLWLTVQDQYYITLSVKSCSHASMVLTEIPGDVNGRAIEIVLGLGRDPENEIRNAVGGEAVATDNTKKLLSCDFYNAFWVRWTNIKADNVQVGRGAVPGQTLIMSYRNMNPFHVNGFSVSSQEVVSSDWRFGIFTGNKFHASTSTKYEYDRIVAVPRSESFTFSVKACNDARLLLESRPFKSDSSYEILIGNSGNTKVEILDGPQGTALAIVDKKDVLHCNRSRDFWVSWNNGVRIGLGPNVGIEEVLSYSDEPKYDIQAVSMTTGWESTGQWEWSFEEDKMVRMSYPQRGSNPAELQWISLSNYRAVILRIRACKQVSMILGEVLGNTKVHAYEVALGIHENKQSAIYKSVGGALATIVNTPELLSCADFRTFWIGIDKDVIKVGRGAELNQNEFMSFEGKNVHFVQALGLTDSAGGAVDYEFFSLRGNFAEVKTRPNAQYERVMVTPSQEHLTFRIRTCSEAHIALMAEEGSDEMYEIVLGTANFHSEIRKRPDLGMVKYATTLMMFDCNVARYFWVSWADSTVRVGYGLEPGSLEFLFFVDRSPITVKVVSVASGFVHSAVWDIEQQSDDELIFPTSTNSSLGYSRSPIWSVFDRQDIVFNVQACSDAHLAVSTVPGVTSSLTYEVVIREDDKSNIVIKDGVGGTVLESADKDNLLSCDAMKTFWMAWSDKTLAVGQGNKVGEQEVISYKSQESLTDITAITFDTFGNVKGKWDFKANMVIPGPAPSVPTMDEITQVQTYGTAAFDKVQLTLVQDNIVFEVMACKEAMIAISKVPQQLDKDTWVITLGSNDNSETEVVQRGSSEAPVSFPSKEVLGCNEYRKFWVQWVDSTLDFGTGNKTGENKIGSVALSEPDLYPFMAFDTGKDVQGYWRFLTHSAHDLTLSTMDQYMYNQTWLSIQNSDSIIFQVKACSDAYILLSVIFDDTTNIYEVGLGTDNNVHSEIRQKVGGLAYTSAWTPDILSCDEYRTFWILWIDKMGMDVGRGSLIGANRIMIFRDLRGKDISAISFSTGFGSTGQWHISNVGINSFAITTPADGNMQRVLIHEEVQHFGFFVRTCSYAAVILSYDPLYGGNTAKGLRVIFGEDDNTKINIVQYPGVKVLASYEMNEVVSCHAERYFWMAWSGKSIQIGLKKLLQGQVLNYTDEYDVAVSTLSLHTFPGSGTAFWEYPKDLGKSTRILVEDKKQSYTNWLDVTDMTEINMKVKACMGASMILASYLGVTTTNVYEIVIGDLFSDSINSIRNGVGGEIVAGDKTKDVLDCTEMRWLWLAWTDSSLTLGSGVVSGGNVLLNWTGIPNPIPIKAFAIRGVDTKATFEFAEIPSGIYEVATPTKFPHNSVWLAMHRKYFQFEVRACSGAMIALTEIAGNTTWHAYEVKLGVDNNKTYIYDAESGTNVAEADTPDILDCGEHRSFWIVWTDVGPGRSIHVGSGQLYSKPYIIEYVKLRERAHIRSVSLHSEEQADWKFPDDSGSAITLFNLPQPQSDRILRHMGTVSQVVFKVQACSDANIWLYDHYHTSQAYEVIIGGSVNSQTQIRAKHNSMLTRTAQTPFVLHCDMLREFWISWRNGRIAVGYGGVPLLAEIVSFEDTSPAAVNYLSVTTRSDSQGQWLFYGIPDNTYLVTTPGLRVTDEMAVRFAQGQTTYALGVRACAGAIVRFLAAGRGSTVQYQVTIGSENNEKTIIADADGNALVERLTPDILSCTETRYFGFKWERRTLEMFEVNHQGRSVIAYAEPENSALTSNIHGLTLGTADHENGEWEMSKYEAQSIEYHHIKNSQISDYCCLWLTVQDQYYITFNVKACSHASMALTEIPGDVNGPAIEIVLGLGRDPENEIRNSIGGTAVATDNTKNLLSCDFYHTFWVSWTNYYVDEIRVGRGAVPGTTIIMSYRNNEKFHVNGFSVASQEVTSSDWQFGTYTGNKFHASTSKEYEHNRVVAIPRSESFTFSVKACNDARLLLESLPFKSASSYEVLIGNSGNTKVEILDGPEGVALAMTNKKDVLSCNRSNDFWVSWKNGVRIGLGPDVGMHEILSYSGDTEYDVKAVSMSTGWESKGQWEWQFEEDKMVRMSFPQQGSTPAEPHWVAMSNYRGVVLRIRACKQVSLILAEVLGNTKVHAYEVALGINDNKESAIYKSVGGIEGTRISTPNILSCEEFRTFWIGVEVDTLMVGRGAVLFQNQIMSYYGQNVHLVQALGLTDTNSGPINYEFFSLLGNVAQVKTQANGKFERVMVKPSTKHMSFRIRTCSEAHIALKHEEDSDEMYEIALGVSNIYTEIRKQPNSGMVKFARTEQIFDCNIARYFWVSWDDSTIRVGYGLEPGSFEIMFFADENFMPVNLVSVASGYRHSAVWDIEQQSNDELQFYTSTNTTLGYSRSPTWSVFDRQNAIFSVRACQDVHLALTTVPGVTSSLTYEIVIWDKDNKTVNIKDGVDGKVLQSKIKTNILACKEMRTFWISWADSKIALGQGDQVGKKEFVSYQHNETLTDITSVSFDTFNNMDGKWDFMAHEPDFGPTPYTDDNTIIFTDSSEFERVQVTLTQDFLHFGVKACSSAMLAFSKVPGKTDSDTWVFTLGTQSNTKSQVVKKGSSSEPATFDSPNILACESLRMFWIQFDEDSLSFGKGGTLGNNVIGKIDTDDTTNYNSLSLATGNSVKGEWNILSDSAHDFIASTSDKIDYQQVWMTEYNSDAVVFQVKACSDAHIILSPVVGNTDDVYEVAIGVDDNVHTVIRNTRNGTNHVSAWTEGILDCNEYRAFWIKWLNGTGINVGRGTEAGVGRFVFFRDLQGKDIKSAGFSTGNGAAGSWRFVNVGVNSFTIPTQDRYPTHHILVHDEVNYFEFYVRTCAGAIVWLSRDALPADHPMTGFEVIFGADDNKKILVREHPGPKPVAEHIQAEMVSCHAERYFWISWHGMLKIGTGKGFTDEVLTYVHTSAIFARTIILKTETDSGVALWEFSKNVGKGHKIFVDESQKNADMSWLDLTGITQMNIKVSACEGVSMLLASNHGLSTDSAYEIIIDDPSGDKRHVIRDGIGGNIVASSEADKVLDCSELRWIWIEWTENSLTIGNGVDLGGSMLLNWTGIPKRIPINAFGFRGLEGEAVFEFTDVPEALYEVLTPSESAHRAVWLSMQRQYFTFEVKTCQGAIVALNEIAGNTTWHSYEVRIGMEDENTYIYDAETKTNVQMVYTPGILDCENYRPFWVGWTDVGPGRSIHVGSGPVFAKPYIIEYIKLRESAHIRAVSLDSSKPADWKFPDDSGTTTTLFTPRYYRPLRYLRHLGRATTMIFKLKACNNGNILLYDHHHTDPAYRFIIGGQGNMYAWLIKRGFNIAVDHAVTPNILYCQASKPFWISWTGGRLALGYGNVPLTREILSYEDPSPTAVNYMSITTDGGSEGEWEFYNLPDNTYLLKTVGRAITDDFAVRLTPTQTMLGFAVRSCSDAVVMMLNGGRGSKVMFQLNIGFANNTITQLLNSAGNTLVEVSTPDILHCHQDRPFVVTWKEKMIELFQYDHNGRTVISYAEREGQIFTTAIHGISFATFEGETAEWELPKYEVQAMEYHHYKNTYLANYCCLWLTIQNQYSITFNVKACSHVSIALTEIPGDTRGRGFEFVLGQGSTPANEIRSSVGGTAVVTDDKKDLLSCDYYRSFWIRWYHVGVQELAIGQGTVPGQSTIMQYRNEDEFEIVSLSVASQEVNSSDWRFGTFVGNKFHATTTKNQVFDNAVVIPKMQAFAFSVKACSGARLLLQDLPFHNSPAYEVVLGTDKNSKSEIRDGAGGVVLASVDQDDVLDCNNAANLWVSWTSGIRVGLGDSIGESQFLVYTGDVKHDVSAIALGSGPDNGAIWEWHFEQDNMVRLSFPKREGEPAEFHWVTISNYRGVVLRIRSCDKVSIILTEILGNTKVNAYEVTLGESDNTFSAIYTGVDGVAGVIAHTPDILSCYDFRAFWIATEKDTLKVGYGAELYQNEIMEYTGENVHHIQAMALTDGQYNTVEYEFFSLRGNVARINTDNNNQHEKMVLTPKNNFINFRVQTCSDAHIALFNEEGSEEKYEIILGKSNQKIEIYRKPDSEWDPDVSVPVWLLFDCYAYRHFWISWSLGTIRIGYGLEPGDFEVLFFKDPNPITVRHVSVASGYGFPALWEFEQATEDTVHFLSASDPSTGYTYSPMWTVFDEPEVLFTVQACNDAHVALSTVPGVTKVLTYEIVIGSNDNQGIDIKTSVTGKPIVSKAIPNLLSCDEMKAFWITWSDQKLIIGQGNAIGKNELIGYVSSNSLSDITTLTFDTFNNATGRWDFKTPRADVEKGGGMSGGAKAAAVIGVLLGVVVLAVLGLVAYQKYSGVSMIPSKPSLKFQNPSFKRDEDKANIVDNEQVEHEPAHEDPTYSTISAPNTDSTV